MPETGVRTAVSEDNVDLSCVQYAVTGSPCRRVEDQQSFTDGARAFCLLLYITPPKS